MLTSNVKSPKNIDELFVRSPVCDEVSAKIIRSLVGIIIPLEITSPVPNTISFVAEEFMLK